MNTLPMRIHHCAALAAITLISLSVGAAPNLDPAAPAHFELARAYHEAHGGQALVVMIDGRIVFEHYGAGGAVDQRQMLASGSKSFVGVAAAAAVEDGLLRLDEPACQWLTEWKDDPVKSKITCRQLLTLTSGLTAAGRGAALRSPGWSELLAQPMTAAPGERFEYGAFQLNVAALAIERALGAAGGETFEAYLKRRILDPLGITLEWKIRCDDGHPQVGGGAHMTARDWAAFGEFMRLGGRRDGNPIVATKRLAECLVGTKQNPAYGLTWWLREPVPAEIIKAVPILQRDMGDIVSADWLPDDLFLAAGAGKQRLYVIPSLKLVVARQGDLREGMRFGDAEFLNRLLRGQSESTAPAAARPGANRPVDRSALREKMIERWRENRTELPARTTPRN